MRTLSVYLWKEWRDQRATVLGIVGVQVVACLLLVLLLRDTVMGTTALVSTITLGSLALTLVVFGPELTGGEVRSGTIGFLSRMPSGLRAACLAKTLFLISALAAISASGFLVSKAFHGLSRAVWDLQPSPLVLETWMIPVAVTMGLLFMAVASWLPRSALTVPATVLFVVALLVPCYLILSKDLSLASYLDLERFLDWAPFAALGILWLSFVRGRHAGGGAGASAKLGLAASLLAALPMWTWVGLWMHEWSTARPHEEIRILQGYMGVDGRSVYLNTTRRHFWPAIALRFDVDTGDWSQSGGLNDSFFPIGSPARFGPGSFGEHLLIGRTAATATIEMYDCLDTTTGGLISTLHRGAPYAGLGDRARATQRELAPARLPDGRPVWFLGRTLETDGKGGAVETLPWDRRDAVVRMIGYGFSIYRDGKFVTYDLTRRRRYDGRLFDFDCCWVFETSWLVATMDRRLPDGTRGQYLRGWHLLDPDTGDVRPASGMRDGDRVLAVLDDGRAVVDGREDDGSGVFTVNPTTHARVPLRVDGLDVDGSWGLFEYRAPIRAAEDRRLFYLRVEGKFGRRLTSLARGSNRLTPPVPVGQVLGCPTPATALAIGPDRERLLRIDLLTGETETVFPRPAATR